MHSSYFIFKFNLSTSGKLIIICLDFVFLIKKLLFFHILELVFVSTLESICLWTLFWRYCVSNLKFNCNSFLMLNCRFQPAIVSSQTYQASLYRAALYAENFVQFKNTDKEKTSLLGQVGVMQKCSFKKKYQTKSSLRLLRLFGILWVWLSF